METPEPIGDAAADAIDAAERVDVPAVHVRLRAIRRGVQAMQLRERSQAMKVKNAKKGSVRRTPLERAAMAYGRERERCLADSRASKRRWDDAIWALRKAAALYYEQNKRVPR